MEDDVRDDGKMQMEEQKIKSELCVQEKMEKQEYMEILQQIEVEVECQMVVEIVFEMSLVGLADDIWSEVVLSHQEKNWRNADDAVNACDFGGAVGL